MNSDQRNKKHLVNSSTRITDYKIKGKNSGGTVFQIISQSKQISMPDYKLTKLEDALKFKSIPLYTNSSGRNPNNLLPDAFSKQLQF
eukprot:c25741_g1_i1 orf=311-571(+)